MFWDPSGVEATIGSKLARHDFGLSQILGPGIIPGLRVMRVLLSAPWKIEARFVKHIVAENARNFGGGEEGVLHHGYLLPRCMQKCQERDIQFFVDVVFDEKSWH